MGPLVIDRTKANIRYPIPGNSPGAADPTEDDAIVNEPTPIAPLLLHTCKRYTCLPAIDSTAPPPGEPQKIMRRQVPSRRRYGLRGGHPTRD